MIRTFVALEIPPEVRARIVTLVQALRPALPDVRWQSPPTIHLTLRFLGDTSPEQIDRLRPELERAAAACPVCEVPIGGLGMFPERGRPSVLWIGASAPEPVLELQRACEQAAAGCGFAPETKPFRSHITLGRWKVKVPRPTLPAHDVGWARLDTLVLFQSDLTPRGAVHTPLAACPLSRCP